MDLLRRRNMMQGMGNISPYPDPWEDDGKIWAYYNVTTTEAATKLGGVNMPRYAGMLIDDEPVTPTSSYKFSTTGIHLVKIDYSRGTYSLTFTESSNLVRCYVPNGCNIIANGGFSRCVNLTFVRFPDDARGVGYGCFEESSALVIDDLSLPNVTIIDSKAFRTTKVRRVSNLGTVTWLDWTFGNCSQLEYVELPATLTSLQRGVFDSTALKTIICHALVPPSVDSNTFRGVNPDIVKVPAESVEAYKVASGWSSFASKIQAIV